MNHESLLPICVIYFEMQLKDQSKIQEVFITALPFAFRNRSCLDARGEEDRRFYDERRNGLRNNQQRYTRLGSLMTRLGNILSFVIMVDEAVGSEDTIGLSMNAASVGYSLRSSYPSQTQMPGFLSRLH
ncbi:MAG: hypothetical protein EZS28_032815 [Streblomastix strix]|uniref:Uncharacterized protein n=1 Tax=Streblomastix strix TaxID=222440 RepID=A0A5J4UML6_9EUKA|nr:MAG: hypothetical protein EZS28_032815 [Streblomastix strix]